MAVPFLCQYISKNKEFLVKPGHKQSHNKPGQTQSLTICQSLDPPENVTQVYLQSQDHWNYKSTIKKDNSIFGCKLKPLIILSLFQTHTVVREAGLLGGCTLCRASAEGSDSRPLHLSSGKQEVGVTPHVVHSGSWSESSCVQTTVILNPQRAKTLTPLQ